MNLVDVVIASTVAAIGYAIWVRRDTLYSRIERPLTLSAVLCIAGIALVSPLSGVVIGGPVHAVTGLWHLDTCAGDLCLLGSQIGALSALLRTVFSSADRAAWLRFWVQPVITIAVPCIAACMVLSQALHEGVPDILDVKPDIWLIGFWVIRCGVAVYLWLAGLRVLRVLRGDSQSRFLANAYIVVMCCGVAAGTVQISRVLAGVEPPGDGLTVWFLMCIAYGGTCAVAALSWRLKELRLRGRHRPAPWG